MPQGYPCVRCPAERRCGMGFKPLPIGVDDFQKLITEGYYYVDKTDMIRELLDMKGEVNLFTRPRRFGKTLNISMLRYFFERREGENTFAIWGSTL